MLMSTPPPVCQMSFFLHAVPTDMSPQLQKLSMLNVSRDLLILAILHLVVRYFDDCRHVALTFCGRGSWYCYDRFLRGRPAGRSGYEESLAEENEGRWQKYLRPWARYYIFQLPFKANCPSDPILS